MDVDTAGKKKTKSPLTFFHCSAKKGKREAFVLTGVSDIQIFLSRMGTFLTI